MGMILTSGSGRSMSTFRRLTWQGAAQGMMGECTRACRRLAALSVLRVLRAGIVLAAGAISIETDLNLNN